MALVSAINAVRQQFGLTPLAQNTLLTAAAESKAATIAQTGNFSHSAGGSLQSLLQGVGYSYKFAGENLASGYFEDNAIVQAWLSSPAHRDNLLSPNYTEVGIAGNGQYVVAIFGAPRTETRNLILETSEQPATTLLPHVEAAQPAPTAQEVAPESVVENSVPEAGKRALPYLASEEKVVVEKPVEAEEVVREQKPFDSAQGKPIIEVDLTQFAQQPAVLGQSVQDGQSNFVSGFMFAAAAVAILIFAVLTKRKSA